MEQTRAYTIKLPASLVKRIQHLCIELDITQGEFYEDAVANYTNLLEAKNGKR